MVSNGSDSVSIPYRHDHDHLAEGRVGEGFIDKPDIGCSFFIFCNSLKIITHRLSD